jgi:hypothetical protein
MLEPSKNGDPRFWVQQPDAPACCGDDASGMNPTRKAAALYRAWRRAEANHDPAAENAYAMLIAHLEQHNLSSSPWDPRERTL